MRYKAIVKSLATGATFTVVVVAPNRSKAEDALARIYRSSYLIDLQPQRNNPDSVLLDSDFRTGVGAIFLFALIALSWIFLSYTALGLALLFGGGGIWIAKLLSGKTFPEILSADVELELRPFLLMLCLGAGLAGVGFLLGQHLDLSAMNASTRLR